MTHAAGAAAAASPALQGYEARYLGADVLRNPYPAGCHHHTEWRAGWSECDRELKGEQ
jgi:hypothetical protein